MLLVMPGPLKGETVEVLLSEVQDLLEEEDRRSQSLMTRGTGLAGFVALIVSLVGVVGRVSSSSLESVPAGLVFGLLIAGFAALLLAVFAVVVGILLPGTGHLVASLDEVRRYPTWEYITQDKVMVQGRRMRGLIKSLEAERGKNDTKAQRLKSGYVLLLLGVNLLAIDGLILGYYRLV